MSVGWPWIPLTPQFETSIFVHKDEPLYGLGCQESARSSPPHFLGFLDFLILDLELLLQR